MIEYTVPGPAVPKARPRFDMRSKVTYTDERTKIYERTVGMFARVAMRGMLPVTGEVAVNIAVELLRPKGQKNVCHSRKCVGKADVDNYAKAILDGMNGIVYDDDRQVSKLCVEKLYGEQDLVKVRVTVIEK